MKEGYPERVCDYCQSQLNTFHAFVRKAETTSQHFDSMLLELKQNNTDEDHSEDQSDETVTQDIHYELSPSKSIEVEFIDDKIKDAFARDGVAVSSNGDEGLKLDDLPINLQKLNIIFFFRFL